MAADADSPGATFSADRVMVALDAAAALGAAIGCSSRLDSSAAARITSRMVGEPPATTRSRRSRAVTGRTCRGRPGRIVNTEGPGKDTFIASRLDGTAAVGPLNTCVTARSPPMMFGCADRATVHASRSSLSPQGETTSCQSHPVDGWTRLSLGDAVGRPCALRSGWPVGKGRRYRSGVPQRPQPGRSRRG